METPKPNKDSIPKKIDRYELHDRIGSGGMGTIFKGIDTRLKRAVAVKVISDRVKDPSVKENIKDRFLNEARAAGGLSHPHLVQIFDFNEKDGIAYIVMEYIEGETLDEYIKSKGPLSNEELLRIGREIASALGFAHKRGIVHRDIKPSNIMIEASTGSTKVLDFGIAKFINSEEEMKLTSTGMVLGSTHYLSPEHITGKNLDGRSDLFCLGTLLYEAATGIIPFRGQNSSSILYKIVHTDPQDPSSLRPQLHQGITKVILKALKKNPADRYQKGEDLEKDLQDIFRMLVGESRASGSLQAPQIAAKTLFVRDSQLLSALQAQKLLTSSQALHLRGKAVMDVVLNEGIVSEDDLSRTVAETLSLPWIPRNRLKNLRIQREALELLPDSLLEQYNLAPFFVDSNQKTLSILIDGSSDFHKEPAIAELIESYQLKFYIAGRMSIQKLIHSFQAGFEDGDDSLSPWGITDEQPGLEHRRVLILDARPQLQEGLTRLFKGLNSTLILCTQLKEAQIKAQRDSFDLVLCDRSLVGDELQFENEIHKHSPATEIRLYDDLTQEIFFDSISYRRFKDFFDRLIHIHLSGFSEAHQNAATRFALLGKKVAKEVTQNPRQLDEVYYAVLLWTLDLRAKTAQSLRKFDGIYHLKSIAESLQERYDGRGIRGMRGNQIPLASRVISALAPLEKFIETKLTSEDSAELLNKLLVLSGKQLDPRLAAAVSDLLKIPNEKSSQGSRVVIVDSDEHYAQELSSKLRQMSHATTIYPDGLSALTGIKREKPDLIISEVLLSQLDGFSLVARLRSDEALKEIPIIFLSESSAPEHSTKALQLGADDFLMKSQESDFILTKLERILKKARS